MNPDHVSLLRSPDSGEDLELVATASAGRNVESGHLRTASGLQYPIIRGVPRFVKSENYAGSFGFEWNRWPRIQFEDQNAGRPMAGHTTRMWNRITKGEDRPIEGRTIVEFGCGPGRFLDVVRRRGGIAVGLDLSAAVEAARSNFRGDENVLIVQGDILNPPFRDGVFDGGYSIGVLHHTPDPAAGFRAMAKTVKDGGWVSVSVYQKGTFYDYDSVHRMRRVMQPLKKKFGYSPALAYSYLSAFAVAPLTRAVKILPGGRRLSRFVQEQMLPTVILPDMRWRVLDVFDAITPAIASTHTREEVLSWMEAAGCVQCEPTDWGETSMIATRGK